MEDKTDLRIQKTYLLLHNAFTQLLEEKRFEDFTVGELCDRAMIRRATFYKHFADKYEYFTFYMKEIMVTFQERLAPDVIDGDVGDYLMHMSLELLQFMKEHNTLVQNIKNSSVFPLLLNILLDQMSADTQQVLCRSIYGALEKKSIEGIAAFYAGGLSNVLFQSLKKDEPIDEDWFVSVFSEFLHMARDEK